MSVKLIRNGAWTRVFVSEGGDLVKAENMMRTRLRPVLESSSGGSVLMRVIHAGPSGIELSEMIVAKHGHELVTVEPRGGISFLNDLDDRMRRQNLDRNDSEAVQYVLIQAGYEAAVSILDVVEHDLQDIHRSVHDIRSSLGTSTSFGVSDLPALDSRISGVDRILSHSAYAIGQFTQLARNLRRSVTNPNAAERQRLDDLVSDGEAGSRRVQFIVDRERFHSRAVSQAVATSDLNVVKIFTILWAVFLPGTALINWYGQNFHVMPELSWYWSSWVQFAGVLVLTLVPIITIKRSGQLR